VCANTPNMKRRQSAVTPLQERKSRGIGKRDNVGVATASSDSMRSPARERWKHLRGTTVGQAEDIGIPDAAITDPYSVHANIASANEPSTVDAAA
jgi:hypothetical protein